jgi:hypothetical protein
MASPKGRAALPANLPEWQHVDMHAKAWAIRHYDLSKVVDDSSSPMCRLQQPTHYTSLKRPLGVVFNCDYNGSVDLLYLSTDEKWLERCNHDWVGVNKVGLVYDFKEPFQRPNNSIVLSNSSLEIKPKLESDLDVENFAILVAGSLGRIMNM